MSAAISASPVHYAYLSQLQGASAAAATNTAASFPSTSAADAASNSKPSTATTSVGTVPSTSNTTLSSDALSLLQGVSSQSATGANNLISTLFGSNGASSSGLSALFGGGTTGSSDTSNGLNALLGDNAGNTNTAGQDNITALLQAKFDASTNSANTYGDLQKTAATDSSKSGIQSLLQSYHDNLNTISQNNLNAIKAAYQQNSVTSLVA